MNKILDKTLAMEQAGGNMELAQELFGMLLKELPQLREKLVLACHEKNSKAMWEHAHKIYGSTAYCGVPALQVAARDMEECIKQTLDEELDDRLQSLSDEIQHILDQGPQWLNEPWP